MEKSLSYTDTELLDALRTGNGLNEAVKYLYRENFTRLRIYIEQNSGSLQDAEDIFQEVIVSFIDLIRLNKFRGESTVKTFLYSLNRNTWLNELKRRGRAGLREEKFEKSREKEAPDTAHLIAGRESRKMIMDLVGSLGDICRKILVAFYYENLSMKEILESMNYENEQVVRNKKYKCLKQLEQMLTEKPELAKSLKNALSYE